MPGRSLYDNITLQNSEYVPRFVGSNVQQLSDAQKQLDERYYKNRDYSDKIAIMLANEQYLEGDKAIKDNLTKSIYGQIDSIGKSDANFENSSAAVSLMAKDFLTNKERIAALDNYKRVEQAKELRSKLGGDALNFGDSLDQFSTIDPKTGQTRRFNQGLEQRLDYDKTREQFYNQIETDIDSGKLTKVDVPGVFGFLSQTVTEQNATKISKYLGDALLRYKTTAEYAQEKKKLQQIDGLSEKEADKTISDNLIAVGKERLLNRKRIQNEQDPFSIYAAKKALEAEVSTTLDRGRTQYLNNPNLPINPFDGVTYDEDGKAKKESTVSFGKVQPKGGLMITQNPFAPPVSVTPNVDKTQELDKVASDIKDTNQRSKPFLEQEYGAGAANTYDLSSFTTKQIGDLHTKAYDKMKSISANPIRPSKDILDALNEVVLNSLPERSIYVLDNKGKPTQGGTYATAMDDLGLSGDDIVKSVEKAKVTGIAPFNPYNDTLAGGFTATINTPKGQRTILVEADQGWQNLFQRSQKLSKAKMTGVASDISPQESLDGYGYKATPLLNPKTQEYDVFITRYDEQYNIIPFESDGKKVSHIPLDDVINMDLDRLTKSGLLRSNLARQKPSSVDNPNE